MKAQELILAAMLLALVGAEIRRPTRLAIKRLEYQSVGYSQHSLGRLEIDDLPPIVTPARGNIDAVTVVGKRYSMPFKQGIAFRRGAKLRIVGWIADPLSRSRGSALLILLDGRERIDESSAYSVPRPDVAKVLQSPAAIATGYRLIFSTVRLERGRHNLQIAVVSPDERSLAIFPVTLRFSINR